MWYVYAYVFVYCIYIYIYYTCILLHTLSRSMYESWAFTIANLELPRAMKDTVYFGRSTCLPCLYMICDSGSAFVRFASYTVHSTGDLTIATRCTAWMQDLRVTQHQNLYVCLLPTMTRPGIQGWKLNVDMWSYFPSFSEVVWLIS